MTRPLIAVLMATTSSLGWSQPAFRAGAEAVAINVSVKRGNTPLSTLNASDFALFDRGVRQSIEAFGLDTVPLDVTLLVDTSGSTAGVVAQMTDNVQRMVGLLHPDDRYRVITIGLSVEMTVPWRSGALPGDLALVVTTGVSLVYDAVFVALTHTPSSGRRHMVVTMSDGRDCGSVLDGPATVEAAVYSDAVLHWIRVEGQGNFPIDGVGAWCTPLDGGRVNYLEQAVTRTGGATHRAQFGESALRTFTRLLDDFRRSYVLHFVPAGVPGDGWHAVRVEVAGRRDLNVTARAGYFVPGRR